MCLNYAAHHHHHQTRPLLLRLCVSRSILTVPWVELGGECSIVCSKSGYSANIVFHTKPFYGGKKHRITADIL